MAILLLGCAGPADVPAGDDSGTNAALASDSGALLVTVTTEPASSLVRGQNTVVLQIDSAETGEPTDALDLTMVPFMPSMGHGASTQPTVQPLGSGRYRFDDVTIPMAGLWELRVTVAGARTDAFAPRYDVE